METRRVVFHAIMMTLLFVCTSQHLHVHGVSMPAGSAMEHGDTGATPSTAEDGEKTDSGSGEVEAGQTAGQNETWREDAGSLWRTSSTAGRSLSGASSEYFPTIQTLSSASSDFHRTSVASSAQGRDDRLTQEDGQTTYQPDEVSNVTSVLETLREGGISAVDTHNGSSRKIFNVDVGNCSFFKSEKFEAEMGEVRGVYGRTVKRSFICKWEVHVPEGMYVFGILKLLKSGTAAMGVKLLAGNYAEIFLGTQIVVVDYYTTNEAVVVSRSNRLYFRLDDEHVEVPDNMVQFQFKFWGTRDCWLHKLHVEYDASFLSGYITSPGFDGFSGYPALMNASYLLDVPDGHVVMVSMQKFEIRESYTTHVDNSKLCVDYVQVSHVDNDDSFAGRYCGRAFVKSAVFHKSVVFRMVTDRQHTKRGGVGFKALFSFHNQSQAPVKLKSGLFNCSVPTYSSFRHHLDCNLYQECQAGDDEGAFCPYSSPACKGRVAVTKRNICLSYHTENMNRYRRRRLSWEQSYRNCIQIGGQLAMLRTLEHIKGFQQMLEFTKQKTDVFINVRMMSSPKQSFYRKMFQSGDGSALYLTDFRKNMYYNPREACVYYNALFRALYITACSAQMLAGYACQHTLASLPESSVFKHIPQLPRPQLSQGLTSRLNQTIVVCPDLHFTFSFLRCDLQSRCVTRKHFSCEFANHDDLLRDKSLDNVPPETAVESTDGVAMFTCKIGQETLPYSLVCDFFKHCPDGSDETFCVQEDCKELRCTNGQCIASRKWCDKILDCVDGSDEKDCSTYLSNMRDFIEPPAIINFMPWGDFERFPMNQSDPCPETHFRCEKTDYCFPVFLRCNGVFDCATHEDEVNCDNFTCPGMYRCRASRTCAHPDHVCDGIAQCPQQDDELLCDVSCPQGCLCQGLAYVCSTPFSVEDYPHLRYLDASRSGMDPQSVLAAFYLVWAKFSHCGLTALGNLTFPNLQTLDLSDNLLSHVDVDTFLSLQNLRSLSLAGNPLVSIVKGQSSVLHKLLQTFDISRAKLHTFDARVLRNYVDLRFLNVSNSNVDRIVENAFDHSPSLIRLDMRGNTLQHFPERLFQNAESLSVIYASDYRLCCKDNLPPRFERQFCFSPQDEISSCEDLLRSDTYRSFLWLISSLSLLGNVGSICFRLLVEQNASKSSFNVFVTNLSFADFLMGVYLAIVGAADATYRGNYLWYEYSWTRGVACKVAGFFSLLSSEVSAFMICFITLDRLIVIRFPFSARRFKRWSAAVCSCVTWVSGIFLAVVPLLPMTSHWEFYSQTGICIPLPITRKFFAGRDYSFGVMIVLNFVLFLLIAAGQGVIYWSVKENSLATDTTRKSQDLTIARRLLTVVISNFLCWFPIGSLGLMASWGVPIPGEVSVAMAIFVLPLNSALNPFLYTFNILMEKRRKQQEIRLMKLLESRLASQKTDLESSRSGVREMVQSGFSTAQDALTFLRQCLRNRSTSSDEIVKFLQLDAEVPGKLSD